MSALQSNPLFGNARNQASQSQEAPRPKSKFWLNVGYLVGERFISLPMNIGLDTMKPNEMRGNDEFRAILQAQNQFREDLLAACGQLSPGESKVIGQCDNGLAIQIMRLKDSTQLEQPVQGNPYLRRFEF